MACACCHSVARVLLVTLTIALLTLAKNHSHPKKPQIKEPRSDRRLTSKSAIEVETISSTSNLVPVQDQTVLAMPQTNRRLATIEVDAIYSTFSAFAAKRSDGSVVTWGDSDYGGDSSSVTSELASGVEMIYSNEVAFAAKKSDGGVVTWGASGRGGDSSSVTSELASGVEMIYSNEAAFAAKKSDGSIVTWGDSGLGGDSSSVTSELASGVEMIYSTDYAFAAKKSDGSVVTWGLSSNGGDSSSVTSDLASGVDTIYSNFYAFAAKMSDGRVITWGDSAYGGDSSAVVWSTTTTSSTATTVSTTKTSPSRTTTSSQDAITTDDEQVTTSVRSDLIEEQRKEEAKVAVEAVEDAEKAEVNQTIALLLNSNQSFGGGFPNVTNPTPTGNVTVIAFSAEAVNATVHATVEVSAGGANAAKVPTEVLLQAMSEVGSTQPVLLSITSMNNATAQKFQDPPARQGQQSAEVSSQVLSVNFWDADGNAIEIGDELEEPIKLVLEVDDPNPTVKCAFWDEQTSRWSVQGVSTTGWNDFGQIVCETTHLSVFGAVVFRGVENAVAVFECNTAWKLLTDEGFENLFDAGRWVSPLPAVMIFLFLSLSLAALMYGACLDKKVAREMELLAAHAAEPIDEPETSEVSFCFKIKRFARKWCTLDACALGGMRLRMQKSLARLPYDAVNGSAELLHGYRTGMDTQSLRIVLVKKMQQSGLAIDHDHTTNNLEVGQVNDAPDGTGRTTKHVVKDMAGKWGMESHGISALETMLAQPLHRRVWWLMPAFLPWISCFSFNLLRSHAVRVSLLVIKVLTGSATAALFYSDFMQDEARCRPPRDDLDKVMRDMYIGIFGAITGDAVIMVLSMVGRRAVDEQSWSLTKRLRELSAWRLQDVAFWFFWTLYSSGCVLYLLLFVSNMDARNWLVSNVWSLCQDLLLKPLAMSVALNIIAGLALRSDRVQLAVKTSWLLKGIATPMTEQEMDELKKTFKKLEANQETTSTGDEDAFSVLDVIKMGQQQGVVDLDKALEQAHTEQLQEAPMPATPSKSWIGSILSAFSCCSGSGTKTKPDSGIQVVGKRLMDTE